MQSKLPYNPLFKTEKNEGEKGVSESVGARKKGQFGSVCGKPFCDFGLRNCIKLSLELYITFPPHFWELQLVNVVAELTNEGC